MESTYGLSPLSSNNNAVAVAANLADVLRAQTHSSVPRRSTIAMNSLQAAAASSNVLRIHHHHHRWWLWLALACNI
jgi:hypothetical protein